MGNKIFYKGYGIGETTQVSIMPTATADNSGAIVQYVGATNANYINGYFYKYVSDGGITPTYSWEKIQVSDGGDGTPHWSGTRAEYEAIKDTLEAGTYVSITDDYDDGLEVVDVIENGNMNPVTSNAVAVGRPEYYNKQLTITAYEAAQLAVTSAYLRGQKVICKDGKTRIFGKIILGGVGNAGGSMNKHPCKLTGFPGSVTVLTGRLPCSIWSGWTGFFSMDVIEASSNTLGPIIAGAAHSSNEEACFTPVDVVVEVTE